MQGHARFLSGSASGGILSINGAITADATATLTLGGSNTGANVINGEVSDGSESLGIVKSDSGSWALSNAANSFTGPVRITGGTLQVSKIDFGFSPSSLGSSSNAPENLVIDGGTLRYAGGTALTDRSFTIEAGGATIDVSDGNAELNTLGAAIGAGNLTKAGPGKLILSAVNKYTGDTVVSAGTLQVGDNTPSTAILPGDFSVSADAQLVFSRNIDNVAFTTQSISGDGDVMFIGQGQGYFTWRGNYIGALTYTGKTIVNYDADAGGTWFERGFWLEKDDLLPHTTVLDVLSGKVFLRANTTNGETISGLMGNADTWITTDQAEVQMLTLDVPTGQTPTYNGVIGIDSSLTPIDGLNAGNIALIKNGAGKQILAGANTYSGPTTINGGTLVIAGSITGASTTVGNGAILASGEAGTIQTALGGNVEINSGGRLAPGDLGTAGTLTIDLALGGKLNFAAGATLDFDLGPTADVIRFAFLDDWLNGSGNATLALGGTINYTATYSIFENVTTPDFTFEDITGYDAANYSAVFARAGDNYRLSFVAIPEPASALTLLAGFGGLLGLARFRKHRRAGDIRTSGAIRVNSA